MLLDNQTPFAAERLAVSDNEGHDLLLVLIKATYQFDEKGNTAIASAQSPVELADQYRDEPGKSSLKYASDFSTGKTGTDVVMVGHAYSPRTKVSEVVAGVRVGALQKTIKVFGDRYWRKTLGLKSMSSPEPFEKVPLVYELAFGGADTSHADPTKHDYERRNPVGAGFRAKKSQLPIDDSKLPNIEDPADLISGPDDRPKPAGFGAIGPSWQPRLGYAGTYDEAWQKGRMPLLPKDFDLRFFNVAHPDLVSSGFLKGNEKVSLAGVFPHGPVSFALPAVKPGATIQTKSQGESPLELHLDRLVIDADSSTFMLLWSGGLKIPGQFHDVETVTCTLHS